MTQVLTPAGAIAQRPPGASPVTLYVDRATGLTTEALATLTIHRGDAAATTGSTYAPSTGKTFRLLAAHFTGLMTSTGILAVKAFVRSLQSGTVTVTGPVRLHTDLHIPATTAVNGLGVLPVDMNVGDAGLLEVPAGGSLGFSHVSSATTYSISVMLTGYEY